MPKRLTKLKLKNLTSCSIVNGGNALMDIYQRELRRHWSTSWWGLLARKAAAALEAHDPEIWENRRPARLIIDVSYQRTTPVTDAMSLIQSLFPVAQEIKVIFVDAAGVEIATCTVVC